MCIPVLFIAGVDYIDAPTPYLMGLHSNIDISYLTLDGVSFFLLKASKKIDEKMSLSANCLGCQAV